jgi:hypothetical protein
MSSNNTFYNWFSLLFYLHFFLLIYDFRYSKKKSLGHNIHASALCGYPYLTSLVPPSLSVEPRGCSGGGICSGSPRGRSGGGICSGGLRGRSGGGIGSGGPRVRSGDGVCSGSPRVVSGGGICSGSPRSGICTKSLTLQGEETVCDKNRESDSTLVWRQSIVFYVKLYGRM